MGWGIKSNFPEKYYEGLWVNVISGQGVDGCQYPEKKCVM